MILQDVVSPSNCVVESNVATPATRNNISERMFYRYRFAIRNHDKTAFHWLWFVLLFSNYVIIKSVFPDNRFARKLTEFFVISVLNRIERNEMDHLKKIQEERNYRKIIAKEYIAALESGLRRVGGPNARLGKVFMMPQTFVGSRQYYQQKYANLMTMVRRLGNPTWL